MTDERDPDQVLEDAVDAAYEWYRDAALDHERATPPPEGTPSSAVPSMSYEEFMAAPRVERIDWENSTLQVDEIIADMLGHPINFHLVDPAFDEMAVKGAFDLTYYHLFSYFDHAVRRILFSYPQKPEVVSHVVRRVFPFDMDQYIQRYGQLDERIRAGREELQPTAFALIMWMAYIGCVTLSIPTVYPNDGVDQSVLAEARAKALESMGGLTTWMPYAKSDLQYATAFRLRRGAEAIVFELLGAAATGHPPGPVPQLTNIVNFHGSVLASQIRVGSWLESSDETSITVSGDYINAGDGATVVNRSLVIDSFNRIEEADMRDELEHVVRAVEVSQDAEAADLVEAIVSEVAGGRRRSILRPLWDRLREIVPVAATAVTAGSKLYELLN